MGFTREQLDAVETEIAALKVGTFSVGELSVDQEKTLAALVRLREVIKTDLAGGEGIIFGKARIDGMD
ncbi:MAG: hypothetical protein JW765_09830 [Deltaproteobacteria bacterium]|nr:hypothetical protein [Candidatus Zymogenaceae bacterium]